MLETDKISRRGSFLFLLLVKLEIIKVKTAGCSSRKYISELQTPSEPSGRIVVQIKGGIHVPFYGPKETFAEEKTFEAQGYRLIAGVDEVGRGALAGPIAAAAVILPRNINGTWLNMVRDSKQLTPAKRQHLSNHIRETAIAFGIGMVSHEVINTRGIIRATRLAMKLAIDQLSPSADSLLIDYMQVP